MADGFGITRTIRTKLAIEGEREYKQAVADINRELKTHKSELALVESQYKGMANSSEALAAKGKVLAEILEKQQLKVTETAKALQNSQDAQKKFAEEAEKARVKLAGLEKEMEALKQSSSDTGAAQAALAKEIADTERSLAIYENSIKSADNSTESWQARLNTAQKDVNNTNFALRENSKHLKEAADAADGCATSIDRFGKATQQSAGAVGTLAAALAAAGVAYTVKEIAGALNDSAKASQTFHDAMAGVSATTDAVGPELKAMGEELKTLATQIPVSVNELAKLAEMAGQLGVEKENVVEFARVMSAMSVTTTLTSEEAALNLAKFANVTQLAQGDFERLASVFLEVGDSMAATDNEIAAMAPRLAAAGNQAGMTAGEIVGLAGALASMGVEAQAGGTAFSKVIDQMTVSVETGNAKLEDFARIAGMSADDFARSYKDNAAGALVSFVEGLNDVERHGKSTVLLIEELGLKEIRLRDALTRAAGAGDLLRNALDLGNQAWAENIALAESAETRYATTKNQIVLFENAVTNLKIAVGDQLNPAINAFAAAGADIAEWAAKFVSENKAIVPLLTGLTAAMVLAAAGISGLALAMTLAKPIVAAFNAVLALNPAIQIAMAVGLLVTALAPLIVTMATAKTEAEEYAKSVEKMRKAHEDSIAAIEKESNATLDILAVYENLAAKTNKTEAEKQALLSVTDKLIQAVPELSGYYDEQAGKLNLTAEAIRNLAQAEALRRIDAENQELLVEEYINQAKAIRELEEKNARLVVAKIELAEAEELWIQAQTDSTITGVGNYKKLSKEVFQLEKDIAVWTKTLDEANQKISDMRPYEDLTKSLDKMAAEYDNVTSAIIDNSAATEGNTAAQYDFSAALSEQEKAGKLSLETVLAMIEAGQEEYLVINAVTGAVELNTAAIIEKQKAEIEAQASALLYAAAGDETASAMIKAGGSALEAAKAFLATAEAQALASGEQKSYAAQISALSAMYDSLGKSAGGAARATGGASKAMTSQAQKDLAEFQRIKKELDHSLKMGETEQAEYYERLAEARDKYLTDESNLDTHRSITESIFGFEQNQMKEAEKAWKEHIKTVEDSVKAMAAEAQVAWNDIKKQQDEVAKQQEAMQKKLEGYGDLFTIDKKKGQLTLESLEDQIKALNEYDRVMSELKPKLGEGLMMEISAMGVDDAIAYSEQLLKKSEKDLEEYNQLYEEKQKAAAEIAAKYYKEQVDEVEKLKADFIDTMQEAMDTMQDTTLEGGKEALQKLIDGMKSKEADAIATAKRIAAEIAAQFANIPMGGSISGSHMAGLQRVPYDGYVAELHAGEQVLTKEEADAYIAAAQPSPLVAQRPAQTSIDPQSMAGIINAFGTLTTGLNSGGGSGDLTVIAKLGDGTEISRAIIKDFRRVDRQDPERQSDF